MSCAARTVCGARCSPRKGHDWEVVMIGKGTRAAAAKMEMQVLVMVMATQCGPTKRGMHVVVKVMITYCNAVER